MAKISGRDGALSIDDFCDAYTIKRRKAYLEIARGALIARKVGRRTIILRRDAAAWAASLPMLNSAA